MSSVLQYNNISVHMCTYTYMYMMASIHHWISPILNMKAWNIHTLLSNGELNRDTHTCSTRDSHWYQGLAPVPETHTGTRDPRLHQDLKLVPKLTLLKYNVQYTNRHMSSKRGNMLIGDIVHSIDWENKHTRR